MYKVQSVIHMPAFRAMQRPSRVLVRSIGYPVICAGERHGKDNRASDSLSTAQEETREGGQAYIGTTQEVSVWNVVKVHTYGRLQPCRGTGCPATSAAGGVD